MWWVTYLPFHQHNKCRIFLVSLLPGYIAKATEVALKIQDVGVVYVTEIAYLCSRKTTETAETKKNPSSQHGIFNLTRCPTARLQKQKQPRIPSPMKQTEHITRNISAQSNAKHLIEWE